jgi:hypothetical protein
MQAVKPPQNDAVNRDRPRPDPETAASFCAKQAAHFFGMRASFPLDLGGTHLAKDQA